MASELKPCPLCADPMEDRGYGAMHINSGDCCLGGLAFSPDKWNQRATPQPAEVRGMVEARQALQMAGCQLVSLGTPDDPVNNAVLALIEQALFATLSPQAGGGEDEQVPEKPWHETDALRDLKRIISMMAHKIEHAETFYVGLPKGLFAPLKSSVDELRILRHELEQAVLSASPPAPADNAGLVEALEWYAEQTRLCRLIHSEGDAGRNALAADGGKRAKDALSAFRANGAA